MKCYEGSWLFMENTEDVGFTALKIPYPYHETQIICFKRQKWKSSIFNGMSFVFKSLLRVKK